MHFPCGALERLGLLPGAIQTGGDSSTVQHQLKNIQHICGTTGAFAAILEGGSVVTWGNPDYGGDSSRVQDQLKNVQHICGTSISGAFAAILADGTGGDLGRSKCWW